MTTTAQVLMGLALVLAGAVAGLLLLVSRLRAAVASARTERDLARADEIQSRLADPGDLARAGSLCAKALVELLGVEEAALAVGLPAGGPSGAGEEGVQFFFSGDEPVTAAIPSVRQALIEAARTGVEGRLRSGSGGLPAGTEYWILPLRNESGSLGAVGLALAGDRRPAEAVARTGIGLAAGRVAHALEFEHARDARREAERIATQQAALAEEQGVLLDRLIGVIARKDEFLSALAHELRTPLGAIEIWLEILRSEPLSDDATQAVAVLQRSSRKLARLIGDVLELSRNISGRIVLEPRAMDLRALLDTTIESIRGAAGERGVTLRASLGEEPVSLRADAERLGQALSRLLESAIGSVPADTTVEVALERTGPMASIEVRHTGLHLSEDLLGDAFSRGAGDDHPAAPADAGLSLALARTLMDLLGGSVTAQPEAGGATTLFVTLPFEETGFVAPPALASLATARVRPLQGLNIVIVDDHADTLEALARAMGIAGAHVVAVSTAREAAEAIDRTHPEALVSDLAMPVEDGFSLIQRIRKAAPDGERLPAVAVSAHASLEDRRRALEAGYDEHLPKPVEMPRLVGTLQRLTRRHTEREKRA
jgi:signal transduction histidine kinase/CheY-like chemotaxis protein